MHAFLYTINDTGGSGLAWWPLILAVVGAAFVLAGAKGLRLRPDIDLGARVLLQVGGGMVALTWAVQESPSLLLAVIAVPTVAYAWFTPNRPRRA